MSDPLRVVIADDQDLVRSGLEMVVAARGIEVVGSATDGREAVDLVARTKPDVCLMDIRMPVLDGIAATAQIRACGTDLISPVVLDISAVGSIDATALKVIAAASRQAQRYGVRVVLRGAQPAVRRMLHLTHLIRLIEVEREPIPA